MSKACQRAVLGGIFIAQYLFCSGAARAIYHGIGAGWGVLLGCSVAVVVLNAVTHLVMADRARTAVKGICVNTAATAMAIAAYLQIARPAFRLAALCAETAALVFLTAMLAVFSTKRLRRLPRYGLTLLFALLAVAAWLLYATIHTRGQWPFGLVFCAYLLTASFFVSNGEGLHQVAGIANKVSYGIYLVVALIVVAAATQGDCCDGCDCDLPTRNRKKH